MSVVFEGSIASRILGEARFVRVHVPASYQAANVRRFPVLYMQDGQNVFTTVGDHVAYGWGNWALDRTADELARMGSMGEIIIVAVDCSTHRYSEYRGPSSSPKGKPSATGVRRPADLFLRYSEFLIRELKPRMDQEYRTLPDAAHTAIMGASMGGLCSLALAWQNPETFGAAASLSGSFQVEHRQFLRRCLKLYTGLPKPIRIYLDSGVADDSGGDDGSTHTTAVADELRRIGWRDGVDLMHHVDSELLTERQLQSSGLPDHKWAEAMTSQHNEFYWRRRAGRALQFLFAAV